MLHDDYINKQKCDGNHGISDRERGQKAENILLSRGFGLLTFIPLSIILAELDVPRILNPNA